MHFVWNIHLYLQTSFDLLIIISPWPGHLLATEKSCDVIVIIIITVSFHHKLVEERSRKNCALIPGPTQNSLHPTFIWPGSIQIGPIQILMCTIRSWRSSKMIAGSTYLLTLTWTQNQRIYLFCVHFNRSLPSIKGFWVDFWKFYLRIITLR